MNLRLFCHWNESFQTRVFRRHREGLSSDNEWDVIMAQRPSALKLEKERKRQQKQKEKEARRANAKEVKSRRDESAPGEDPDIAGIRPGPQPLPEQWKY